MSRHKKAFEMTQMPPQVKVPLSHRGQCAQKNRAVKLGFKSGGRRGTCSERSDKTGREAGRTTAGESPMVASRATGTKKPSR
jgi:hypothetical protein